MATKVRHKVVFFPSANKGVISSMEFVCGTSCVKETRNTPWIGFSSKKKAQDYLDDPIPCGGLGEFKSVTRAIVYFTKAKKGDKAFCIISKKRGCVFHGELHSKTLSSESITHHPFLFFRTIKDAEETLALINNHTEYAIREVTICFPIS